MASNSKRPRTAGREGSSEGSASASRESIREQGSLYDAVAGRLGYEGFICGPPDLRGQPSKPEEVLFRRKNAPDRAQEDDSYFANRKLPDDVRLPESDLLKAIHAYASDFYGAMDRDGESMNFKSLDETALIALGILIEEAARHALGETGDLAFVEEAEKT